MLQSIWQPSHCFTATLPSRWWCLNPDGGTVNPFKLVSTSSRLVSSCLQLQTRQSIADSVVALDHVYSGGMSPPVHKGTSNPGLNWDAIVALIFHYCCCYWPDGSMTPGIRPYDHFASCPADVLLGSYLKYSVRHKQYYCVRLSWCHFSWISFCCHESWSGLTWQTARKFSHGLRYFVN